MTVKNKIETHLITCPYCGDAIVESFEFASEGEIICSRCNKLFFYERIVEVKYTSEKIDQLLTPFH
jgi:DNA-directed RNA polymerase subunit RPC12/RpoP